MFHLKDITSSTNDDARALALAGAPHGDAVLARAQSRGRGREGRAFASPDGGMYLSVILRPVRPPPRWTLLPLVAGLAVVDVVRRAGASSAAIKWPNDIMVEDAKLGGVLVETRLDDAPFAIVGIGVNVASEPVPEATSLRALGVATSPDALALATRDALLARFAQWERDERRVLADVRASCATLGRAVMVCEKEGRAVDVADDGALVLEEDGGNRVRIVAGDVRLKMR